MDKHKSANSKHMGKLKVSTDLLNELEANHDVYDWSLYFNIPIEWVNGGEKKKILRKRREELYN